MSSRIGVVAIACAVLLMVTVAEARRGRDSSDKDHYKVLGIEKTALDSEVKKAYKKLTRKYHPDISTDKNVEANRQKFIAITEAYEILSDPEKRKNYDKGGEDERSAGDKQQFLRYNLFSEDFDGVELQEPDMDRLIKGDATIPTFVYFWSSSMPRCIDESPGWRQFAARFAGSSVRVASYGCDSGEGPCRRLRIPDPPVAYIFVPKSHSPSNWITMYRGKFEVQKLTEVAVDYLQRKGNHVYDNAALESIVQVTAAATYPGWGWLTQYMSWNRKRTTFVATKTYDMISFEYSPCFDCNIELQLALESVGPVYPNLRVLRVNCRAKGNKQLCYELETMQKDKAWSIAKGNLNCYYETNKKTLDLELKSCDPLALKWFTGRFYASEFVEFLTMGQKSYVIPFSAYTLDKIKTKKDAYAIMYYSSLRDRDSGTNVQWELLARQVNRYSPVYGSKGYRLFIGKIDCSAYPTACDHVAKQKNFPVVGVYGHGDKVKKLPPAIIPRVEGALMMIETIKKDAEPLHLHVLTPEKWKEKVPKGLNKGQAWFILFNAGSWCPPCRQIRPQWNTMVRAMMQRESKGMKINVGIVECDEHKNFCQRQGLENFPTVRYLKKGKPDTEYHGDRSAGPMAAFAVDQFDNFMVELDGRGLWQKIQSGSMVVVSFGAGEWCPPCTKIKPELRKLAKMLANKVTVVGLNCDTSSACQNFQITGFPTVKLFSGGRAIATYKNDPGGNNPAERMKTWVEKHMKA